MKKLLLFSDLHCDLGAISALVGTAVREQVEIAVGAGDLCNIHVGLPKVIAALRKLPCPAVLTPGNSETTDELRSACGDWPQAAVLHGQATEIGGLTFYGLGGGVPVTPFGDWSYDFTEEEAAELLENCPHNCILVTHSPPHGVVDANSQGRNLGSMAVREAVLDKNPRLVVCGHIHASAGKHEKLGNSLVINAGPKGIVIEIE